MLSMMCQINLFIYKSHDKSYCLKFVAKLVNIISLEIPDKDVYFFLLQKESDGFERPREVCVVFSNCFSVLKQS